MQIQNTLIALGVGMACASCAGASKSSDTQTKPNVLFIIMDDMCDWAHYLGGNNQVITPNLDRLSQRGVWFSNAYSAVPLSNPSRTAMLTGLQPSVTGVYNNTHQLDDSPAVNECVMMPEHFRANGYTTVWAGKIFHNRPNMDRLEGMWDDMNSSDGGYGPWIKHSILPEELEQLGDKWRNFEAWEGPDTDFPDVVNSQYVIDFLGQEHDKPFFVALGFYRPHTPYTAPKRYFEMYDIDQIKRPEILDNDLDDIPQYALDNFIPESQRETHKAWATTGNFWEQLIRAYLASVTFADDRIGMVLDALEASPYADNTIIVLVGDNGFHHGEKERFGKSALWREACHVPFIVSWPEGMAPKGTVETPVSLIDIYPTLISMCGLPEVEGLAGNDISELLKNPRKKWDKPCLSTFMPGNFVVHSEKWNYIRYADGSEELYNVSGDENEFYNLAGDKKYDKIKRQLSEYMPDEWHPGLKSRKADESKVRKAFGK